MVVGFLLVTEDWDWITSGAVPCYHLVYYPLGGVSARGARGARGGEAGRSADFLWKFWSDDIFRWNNTEVPPLFFPAGFFLSLGSNHVPVSTWRHRPCSFVTSSNPLVPVFVSLVPPTRGGSEWTEECVESKSTHDTLWKNCASSKSPA